MRRSTHSHHSSDRPAPCSPVNPHKSRSTSRSVLVYRGENRLRAEALVDSATVDETYPRAARRSPTPVGCFSYGRDVARRVCDAQTVVSNSASKRVLLDSRAGYSGRVGCPKLNSAVRGRAEITAVTARSGQMRRDTRWPDRTVESRPRPPRRRRAPRPQIWERRAEFSVFGVRCEGADGIRTDKHTTTNLSSRAVPNLAPRNKKSCPGRPMRPSRFRSRNPLHAPV